jgi:hypothetical protein
MDNYISRGVSLNLSSIAVNFISNYLDTFKGIDQSKNVIESNKETSEKAQELTLFVMKYNDEYKNDFKESQWSFIENSVKEKLYLMISKNELTFDRVL